MSASEIETVFVVALEFVLAHEVASEHTSNEKEEVGEDIRVSLYDQMKMLLLPPLL